MDEHFEQSETGAREGGVAFYSAEDRTIWDSDKNGNCDFGRIGPVTRLAQSIFCHYPWVLG